jgi:hypothetical protein
MIHDVDSTLRELLKRELAQLNTQLAISFDPPDDQFPPQGVPLPAIDLFLYDIRENHDLRSNDFSQLRSSDGSAVKQFPLVRVDCSYLITAWPSQSAPNRSEDEHMLLSLVMLALLRYPQLPDDVLQGSLRNQALPLPTTALQPGHLQSLGEFWQALGGKPKSALNYTVTIAVQPIGAIVTPLVVATDTEVEPVIAPEDKP